MAIISDGPVEPALQQRLDILDEAFQKVHFEKMFDLPICNHALAVEVLDFQAFEDGWLGTVATPWFLKFFFLPKDKNRWADQEPGDTVDFAFPAGKLKCFVDEIDGLGSYISYSLYSPMANFRAKEDVRKAAAEAMGLLMDPGENPQEEVQKTETQIKDQAVRDLPKSACKDTPDEKRRGLLRGIIGRGRVHEA